MPLYSSPTLFFATMNLNKIGLKATSVTYSTLRPARTATKMHLQTISDEEGVENEAIQLFTTPVEDGENRLLYNFAYDSPHFTVYLGGFTENYKVQHMDGLMSQQLFSSIMDNQDGTDFNLFSKYGKRFPVHKWILAARSNVFEVLFAGSDLDAANSSHSMDFTSDEIEQFIKFLFTGEFGAPTTNELLQLAVNYKVKNLENLLISAASLDVSLDESTIIAMHLEPENDQRPCKLEISVHVLKAFK